MGELTYAYTICAKFKLTNSGNGESMAPSLHWTTTIKKHMMLLASLQHKETHEVILN